MIGVPARQSVATAFRAPEAAKRRRGASYPFLKPLNGASGPSSSGPAIHDLSVEVNVTTLDVRECYSDGEPRDPVVASVVDLHTGQTIAFCQGAVASALAMRALAECIFLRGIPSTITLGEGCDAAVIIALYEELRGHGRWLPSLLTASPLKGGCGDD